MKPIHFAPAALIACTIAALFVRCSKEETGTNDYNLPADCAKLAVYSDSTLRFSLPTAFSPNGDGKNDIARPVFDNGTITNFRYMVYKLNGELIYQTTTEGEGWDGTDGSGMPAKDTLFRLSFRVMRPGDVLTEACTYLYKFTDTANCLNIGSIDPGRLYFEDMFDHVTLQPTHGTREAFCP